MEKEIILSKKIESISPVLLPEVRASMWQKIESSLIKSKPQPTPSPFLVGILTFRSMTAFILLLTLALGGGATALASDAARPGDLLFPLDRALEDVHLNLAFSTPAREALTKKLTAERLQELRDIINEEVTISPSNVSAGTVATSTDEVNTALSIDTVVFNDTTVIRMEQDGQTFYFETEATTTTDVIVAILGRFPILTVDQITEALTLSIGDRESMPNDKGVIVLSNGGEKRINHAVEEILHFLDKTSDNDSNRKNLMAQLSKEVSGVTGKAEVRHNKDGVHIGSADSKVEITMGDDGTSQVSVRGSGDRIRVEEKDDAVSVRTAEVSDKNEEKSESSQKVDANIAFEVEAKIFNDTTVVKMSFGDQVVSFTTVDDTKADIISAIKEQFPSLTEEQISSQLKIEVENRQSKPEDSGKKEVIVAPLIAPVVGTSTEEQHDDGNKREGDSYESKDKQSDSNITNIKLGEEDHSSRGNDSKANGD
ncbi:hypothetical protein A2592_00965 [Candidatus Kaiserbacteria bacterium RIFOXYD1_FULL_42_15]|uniref:DUF5667 domain-containing protein n=1 Tax=Candidatus Kaiserbacteria bacterium RIFOXYD1_FULL_42_15 TaxID=1798532 RepID=A0A1F6FPA7_9BACT|nr:MAG: hypothetical protein A2592_00965 [Candidatus Kaiserbacteria bacterium RIFOXYD1_FULL_42_15]